MPTARKHRMRSRRGEPWTITELKQLGKVPDSVLARRTGRTITEGVVERKRRRVRLPTPARRWTAREIGMLGHDFDTELARRLRRSVNAVRRQRAVLHIPPFRPWKGRSWTR